MYDFPTDDFFLIFFQNRKEKKRKEKKRKEKKRPYDIYSLMIRQLTQPFPSLPFTTMIKQGKKRKESRKESASIRYVLYSTPLYSTMIPLAQFSPAQMIQFLKLSHNFDEKVFISIHPSPYLHTYIPTYK